MMGSNLWTPDGRAWPGPNNVPIFPDRRSQIALLRFFAVRVATWLNSSDIVFVRSTTNVMLACVAVERFASARVWSCCISVKSAALDFAACTFAA